MAGFAYLTQPPAAGDNAPRRDLFTEKQAAQRAYVAALKTGVDPERQGRAWADLADRQCQRALDLAWRNAPQAARYGPDLPREAPVPGLFILGLGKHGGQDLNFSSDIDLVAFYDPGRLPVPAAAGRTYICAEVLRAFIKLIDGHKAGRFVWRTDWRLRPDPSVTDLAMSTQAGLEYFYFKSAPWRRLAMVKARFIAGDRQAAEAFLADLHNFIWRRNLDFSMVEEIAGLKNRIHLEHPDLAEARRLSHNLTRQEGFHLKLGRGGIRDIEFITNALQLLWGGRQATLQTTHTQTALRALKALGLLDNADTLLAAYHDFRRLENAVQTFANEHKHKLPSTRARQEWLSQVWHADYAQILEQVAVHRAKVAASFDALFEDMASAASAPAAVPVTLAVDLGLSERRAEKLVDILTQIDALIQAQEDREAAKQRLARWLRRFKGVPTYLRALQSAPDLAKLAFEGVLTSPVTARLIDYCPLAIDTLFIHGDLLADLRIAPLVERGEASLAATHNNDEQLIALREWINESLYLIYLAMLAGTLDARRSPYLLADLAEAALDLCAQVTAAQLGWPRLPFTILAMGRLGLKMMAPGSDLDLIFILDEGLELEVGNRAVRRFLTTVNVQLQGGRVYEIDTRLRPSGTSGPPTLTYATYAEHQLSRAKTWEHVALTFMRPLRGTWHGDPGQIDKLTALKTTVLTSPRDVDQWRGDCQVMLGRLFDQRIAQANQPAGEVKLAAGGLMELEYSLAAYMLRSQGLDQAKAAADLGLNDCLAVHQQALQYQRLLGNPWTKAHPELATAFAKACQQVRAASVTLLDSPDSYPDLADYTETSVMFVPL